MAINEKKPLFVRIAGERQPNLLPVTASAVGFDFNRDRFVFYHTASDDWTDVSPDGVDFVGSVYADSFFAAGVVTASLGLSGSLTQLADGTAYLRDGNGIRITSASNGPVTVSKYLRDLITFIDQGPACGFASAYKEQGPAGPFPTQSIWYTDLTKNNKIVELIVTWSGPVPSTSTWRAYRDDGATIDCTVVDTYTYVNSIFEETRTRVIT